jgi:hypothetical protein
MIHFDVGSLTAKPFSAAIAASSERKKRTQTTDQRKG